MRHGADPGTWARLVGLDAEPHSLLGAKVKRLDPAPHAPAEVAAAALRLLTEQQIVEWAGDGRWRPTSGSRVARSATTPLLR